MTCLTTGTLITTANGPVRVEDLRAGQLVLTRDNGLQPARRVSRKTMTSRFLLDNAHLKPVLIRKDAFGAGLPAADCMVSPNTRLPVIESFGRVFSREVEQLTAVKKMIDHKDVQQVDTVGLNYVHLSFDQHEIIAVNGVWMENFAPADFSLGALGNAQRIEISEVFPEEKHRLRRLRDRSMARVEINPHHIRKAM